MLNKYNPKKIEKKWQKYWELNKTFEAKEDKKKEKFYGLIEFPYPSGEGLHVGHPRPFTAMDVISRKKRMEGKNVLFPIGFDAFGLPTENYAIKTGKPPAEVTKKNVANFTRQLKMLGYSFDWSRVVNTTDPQYYKWTQWIFLQLFKQGLAYKKNMPINWCLLCKIGLANEEVVDGKCERCGGSVEKRDKEQWMLSITKYADKLLEGLKEVDYIERAKVQQENWIGRSEGALIKFQVINLEGDANSPLEGGRGVLEVFTTRPDTLFGATYMVVAPEHILISNFQFSIFNFDEVKEYVEQAKKKSDLERTELQKEKTGVELKGIKAVNPVNGEQIPIFVADYVLASYGTGAIMAVPAHDERDWEFAKKYGLETKEVVLRIIGEKKENAIKRDAACAILLNKRNEILVLYNKIAKQYQLPGGGIGENDFKSSAIRELREETGYKNFEYKEYLGKLETNYYAKGRDEQRNRILCGYLFALVNEEKEQVIGDDKDRFDYYWMTPKDALKKFDLNNESWGDKEIVEKYLIGGFQCFSGDGVNINSDFLDGLETKDAKEKMIKWLEEKGVGKRQTQYKLRDWVFSRQRYWGEPIPLAKCEKCDWVPLPENQLPLELPKIKKYQPTDTGESPLSAIEKWVNTKCPQCGGEAKRETDVMPNWAGSSWYFLAYTMPRQKAKGKRQKFDNIEFIWDRKKMNYWLPIDWYNGGMEHTVLHLLYSRFWNQFLYDIGAVPFKEPYKKRTSHGMILGPDGEKMSKSRGNVINPDEMVEKFGSDAFRTYIMFMGPFDQAVAWDTNGLVGVRRFLDRVWGLKDKCNPNLQISSESANIRIQQILHQTIKKVTEDIDKMHFNTAIAKMMELVNEMSKLDSLFIIHYSLFIKILSPFAPHICEELWSLLGNKKPLAFEPWPAYDESKIVEENITLVVQVNGKVRDNILVPADISEEEAKEKALTSEKVIKWLDGKEPKKVIYVKGKLVSVVV